MEIEIWITKDFDGEVEIFTEKPVSTPVSNDGVFYHQAEGKPFLNPTLFKSLKNNECRKGKIIIKP